MVLSKKEKTKIVNKYGKIPSKKEILQKIKHSQERLVVSLAKAWETAPDDPEIRRDIIAAMQKALELRSKIYSKVVKETPPEIRESYDRLSKIIEKEAKSGKLIRPDLD